MSRILAIDYGKKRTGLAVTDPLQIIPGALATVATQELYSFLKKYTSSEQVSLFVIGDPRNWDGSDTDATPLVRACIKKLQKEFPAIPIVSIDERNTSKMAKQAMIEMGMKKKQRRDKALVDQIAATLILQAYLDSKAAENA